MKLPTIIIGLVIQLLTCFVCASDSASDDPFTNISDDPFSDEPAEPHIPKKASYLETHKKANEIKIITKDLAFLLEDLNKLPITKREISELPHTSKGDIVYEITHLFPNCQDNPNLWVLYNATSSHMIAKADPLLSASVNEYAYKTSNRQTAKMKISGVYLKLDSSIPLDFETIQKSKHEQLMRFSFMLETYEKFYFKQNSRAININYISSPYATAVDLDLDIYHDESLDVRLSCSLETEKNEVMNLGISNGKQRHVLILFIQRIDIRGIETPISRPKKKLGNRLERSLIKDQEYLFYRLHDLNGIFSGYRNNKLTVNPDLRFFHEDAIIYDFKDILAKAGITLTKEAWTAYDPHSGLFVATGNKKSLDSIQEILESILISHRPMMATVTNFYEVNSKNNDTKWNLLDVLSSDPVLIGNVGYTHRNGERSELQSKYGSTTMESMFDETGLFTDQVYRLDLKLRGRKIKSNLEIKVPNSKPHFVEIVTKPESKRTIVMMIHTQEKTITP